MGTASPGNDNYHDDRSLWELNLYLPAEAYARMNPDRLSKTADIIKATLNEITRPQQDHFVSVSFYPDLVDELTFSQKESSASKAKTFTRQKWANC